MIYFDRIEVVNMLVPSAGTKSYKNHPFLYCKNIPYGTVTTRMFSVSPSRAASFATRDVLASLGKCLFQ